MTDPHKAADAHRRHVPGEVEAHTVSAFDHPALDEIREVLGTVGWYPLSEPPHPEETVMMIDIDDAADEIVKALRRRGFLA